MYVRVCAGHASGAVAKRATDTLANSATDVDVAYMSAFIARDSCSPDLQADAVLVLYCTVLYLYQTMLGQ